MQLYKSYACIFLIAYMHACIKKVERREEGKVREYVKRAGRTKFSSLIGQKGGKDKILVSNWSKKNSKKTKKIQYKQF